MDKKFEIGDRVRSKFYGVVGTITEIDTDGYILKPDTDDDMWIADTDVEPYDPKTAFLSELKGLLEKYDAKMSADVSGPDLDCAEIDMLFLIGDDEIRFDVSMFNSFITPDNIIESACYDE